jgi:hypothetical protein
MLIADNPVFRLGNVYRNIGNPMDEWHARHSSSFDVEITDPRYGSRVGLHIFLFEACSTFTHVAACTLALSPIRDTLIEGFSPFVTSMTAPIASGWSGCRVGLAPTGKRRLCTAHARTGSRHNIHLRCTRRSIYEDDDRTCQNLSNRRAFSIFSLAN